MAIRHLNLSIRRWMKCLLFQMKLCQDQVRNNLLAPCSIFIYYQQVGVNSLTRKVAILLPFVHGSELADIGLVICMLST
jgi:hypothetical protein